MAHRTTKIDEVKRQARRRALDNGDVNMDPYQTKAAQFRNRMHIDDSDAQFKALVEEVGELAEALNRDEDAGGELADVLVTAFVLADIEGVNVRREYDAKMRYNLGKSGRKEGGKVVDDG